MNAKRYFPLLALLASPLAFAHPGHAEQASFMSGFLHPLTGLDHMLAMLAVGLWSTAYSAKPNTKQLALPATFIFFLLAGLAIGVNQTALPAVESMIAASLLVMGLLASVRRQISQTAALGVVALFALFHGYAHGSELGANAAAIAGMTLATAMLHASGMALGLNAKVRRAGAALVAAGGVYFLLQLA